MCMFCRSLFILLYLFAWPLCCLFSFDMRILITPLVSPNSLCITKADLSKIIQLAISRYLETIFQLTTNHCVVNGEQQVIHNIRVGRKSIRPFAPILTLRWSYLLSAVHVHTTAHCMLNREQLDPAPPKARPTQFI